ncbi:FecCD family ABC transporter permease [Actinoalloteichus caeruleus]|uniref:Iron complex transport system permease protein n=3 Tax=Actinoalloteichus cyanogriseus TaxID=2893586 RepID=A0ABT1JQE2_ACTCY|nr:iron chelate uptake ABC transporter family permease subunit [Actinoalloteichus caeruleus]MCP2333911.1 iron complex transport system permease protein [Actinoalloteichus caeruleus DSM 43889]
MTKSLPTPALDRDALVGTGDGADLLRARRVVSAARLRRGGRATAVTLVLAVAVVLVFGVSLSLGEFPIPLRDVAASLVGLADPATEFVVRDLRLPRALVGILVGAAFGLSGALFQSMVRNPLASPDIIGITSGASAAAVFGIVVLGLGGVAVSVSALAGAMLTALAIYLLAWRRGVSGYRLVLVGIGAAAILNSAVSYLMTRSRVDTAQQALAWMTGSLNARTWDHVVPLTIGMAVLLPLVVALSRPLRALQLGDAAATSLGVGVERSRLGLVLVAVALAGVATAAAGPVAFVAFLSAPIARRLTRGAGLALLPAALVGALVVGLGDVVGQHLVSGAQFPVGVVTGAVGAPYLLWLLAVSNRVGRGG